MKKIFFISVAAMFSLISCKNPATSNTGPTTSQGDMNMASNLKIYKAIESGDMSGMDTLFADDVVDYDGPNGTEVKGKDSVMKMLSDFHNQIKDIKFDVITSAANNDYVFTLVHITGTVADSAMHGKQLDEKSVDVIKFNGNKITAHWGFTDDVEVSKQMMEMHDKMSGMDKDKMKK